MNTKQKRNRSSKARRLNQCEKVYVAYKELGETEPEIMCKFHKKGPWQNLSEHGLGYYEDEVGWYFMCGEIECTAD